MPYLEFTPSAQLQHLIESYWISETFEGVHAHKILPDGCMDILFNLGEEIHSEALGQVSSIPKYGVSIVGMMTRFSEISMKPQGKALGIRFRPGQFSKLTGIPLSHFRNELINANEILPKIQNLPFEQLFQLTDPRQQIRLLEQEFYNTFQVHIPGKNSLVTSVTDFILEASSPVKVQETAKVHGISVRQLERVFQNQVGVTAKEFASIIRFKRTLRQIALQPEKSLLHIAFENGYYDHAHLTREFKKFSGISPSTFR
ncbi:helix-turn-helix domain-containing protein [Rapidithrix thailandica]|uniref:Helix-turn-helix domain-containing protein n=1 Tax=Rapidithrix thailandica TaxID=413964 RepID=A0AAW9SCE7_9BACT